MIRTSYIHEFDALDAVNSTILAAESASDQIMNDYFFNCEKIRVMNLMESTDESDPYFTEGAKQAVEKIGEFVDKIIDSVIELFRKIKSKVNELLFGGKSDVDKLEKFIKAHPKVAEMYKDEIKLAITKGDLDMKDIKSMEDLMSGSNDILTKLNKGQINPSEAEKRFDKVVNNWDKYGKPIVEVVAGISTIITGIRSISGLHATLAKNRLDKMQYQNQLDQIRLQGKMEARVKNNGEEVGVQRVKNKIISKTCSLISNNVNKYGSSSNKIAKGVSSILTKLENALKKAESSEANDKAKLDELKNQDNRFNAVISSGTRALKEEDRKYNESLKAKEKEERKKEKEEDRKYNESIREKERALQKKEKQKDVSRRAREKYHDQELRSAERQEDKRERRQSEQRNISRRAREKYHDRQQRNQDAYNIAYDQEIARIDAKNDRGVNTGKNTN